MKKKSDYFPEFVHALSLQPLPLHEFIEKSNRILNGELTLLNPRSDDSTDSMFTQGRFRVGD